MGKGLFTSSISGRGLRKKLRSFLNGKEVKPSNKAVFNQASPAGPKFKEIGCCLS